MSEILIASMSPVGHIAPLLNVAQGLVDRGDRVTVLSCADHAGKIRAVGATPHAIPSEADFDMTRLDIDLPGRTETSGIKRVRRGRHRGGHHRRPRRVPAEGGPADEYFCRRIHSA